MATTNYKLRELLATDFHDETVVNDALNLLDQRALSLLDLVILADSNITLTSVGNETGQASNSTIRVRDPSTLLTITRRITFPAIKGTYTIENTTAQGIEVWLGSGAVATIPTVDSGVIYSDGTDMLLVKLGTSVGGGGSGLDYSVFEIPMTFIGAIGSNRELVRIPFVRPIRLPTGLTSSRGSAGTAPTGAVSFELRRNGVSIGTANFAAAATVATFVLTSAVTFSAGDTLELISPDPADATLANVGFMFHAEKV